MLRILNCLVDDGKFVNYIIAALDYVKENHKVYHVLINPTKSYTAQSTIEHRDKIVLLHPSEVLYYVKDNAINTILMNGINSFPIKEIEIPANIKVVWKAWGYDIYRYPTDYFPLVKLNLYRPETRRIRAKNFRARWNRFKMFVYYILFERKKTRKALSRIDYFSGVIAEEFDLIEEKGYPFFKATKVDVPYYGFNPNVKPKFQYIHYQLGNNIQCGGSAGDTNNHIYVLKQLKRINLRHRKIIVPLSYGGDHRYKSAVIDYINKNVESDKVEILDNFLPVAKYVEVMRDCGFSIFGNEQQAAMGNIYRAINYGHKVFLSKTSIVYRHFVSRGFKIFSIQEDLNENELSTLLDEQSRMKNQKLYFKFFSAQAHEYSLRQTLYTIDSNFQRK